MSPHLPIIPSSQSKNKPLSDNKIPRWTFFSLCFITTLVVVSLIKAYLPLLVSTLAMLFVWSQMTKPVEKIKPKSTKDKSNQLNFFHKRYKIGRKYSEIKTVLHKKEDAKVA